ncbi:hypothetical protein WICPIJ_000980 [Wickerhamomyces pijperi]|uniref:Glycosyltransferase family 71 protein n=1 Tax=Wickerhamomyces pijperi TaxID=599730 RepID=A0A9P8QCM0_WICPI|nr:hypothetical protein WICPIJ_000980 [Wickerhamomyces pijperi]
MIRLNQLIPLSPRAFLHSINIIPRSRRGNLILIAISLILLFFTSVLILNESLVDPVLSSLSNYRSSTSTSASLIKYLRYLQSLQDEIPTDINFLPGKQTCVECPFTESDLSQHINYEEESTKLENLKEVHSKVWEYIQNLNPKDIVSASSRSRGIVILGGGKYSIMSLLSIESLRHQGSELPIELMIPTRAEYDPYLCETLLLSRLKGRCLVLEDLIGSELWKQLDIKSYQLKSLSLMISSFNELIYLDSDNIPTRNIDLWLDAEPYTSKGFVTWPDFWSRGTSRWFYDVAGITVDRGVRVREGRWELPEPVSVSEEVSSKTPFHELKGTISDPSTESGCMLINKTTHLKTLLLSLFYNTYGPAVFYELISQGQWGQGDKETFSLASLKAGEPIWQVRSKIQRIGIDIAKGSEFDGDERIFGDWFEITKGHSIKTTAMGQVDPTDDYAEYQRVLKHNEGNLKEHFNDKKRNLGLIHANHPKLDPVTLAAKFEGVLSSGKQYRIFDCLSEKLATQSNQPEYDFELTQFRNLWKYTGCEVDLDVTSSSSSSSSGSLKYFEEFESQMPEICQYLKQHIAFLQADHH